MDLCMVHNAQIKRIKIVKIAQLASIPANCWHCIPVNRINKEGE